MYGYKIQNAESGFRFELIPSNNNNQPVGISCVYRDETECRNALNEFSSFVSLNGLNAVKEGILIIRELNNGRFIFEYLRDDQVIFYRNCSYGNKESCKKTISSIYKHIEEYTSNQIID